MVLIMRAGSSPRMRGAHEVALHAVASRGIIPADAGSTRKFDPFHDTRRDHPRGCGEHDYIYKLKDVEIGSSPRMRGAHLRGTVPNFPTRIIPADAGSTLKDHCNPNTMIDKISDFK